MYQKMWYFIFFKIFWYFQNTILERGRNCIEIHFWLFYENNFVGKLQKVQKYKNFMTISNRYEWTDSGTPLTSAFNWFKVSCVQVSLHQKCLENVSTSLLSAETWMRDLDILYALLGFESCLAYWHAWYPCTLAEDLVGPSEQIVLGFINISLDVNRQSGWRIKYTLDWNENILTLVDFENINYII